MTGLSLRKRDKRLLKTRAILSRFKKLKDFVSKPTLFSLFTFLKFVLISSTALVGFIVVGFLLLE